MENKSVAPLKSELFYDFIVDLADKADTDTLGKKAVYAAAKSHFGVDGRVIGGWASALSRKGLITVSSTNIVISRA